MLKRIFRHNEKDQTTNFSPFWSSSNGCFNKVWWKSGNQTEIGNLPARRISNPVKDLWWSLFASTVSGFWPLNTFVRNLHHRCSTGLQFFSLQIFNVNKLYNVVFRSFFLHLAISRVLHSPGFSESRFTLKNICERLFLKGRHWYSTSNKITKFY